MTPLASNALMSMSEIDTSAPPKPATIALSSILSSLHWSAHYIGLPWSERGRDRDGIDCWGLVYLALADQGIVVPRYTEAYASLDERAEIAALIAGDRRRWPWREVASIDARALDVAVFRRAGADAHVGVVVTPGLMLHISRGAPSCVERYDRGRWAAKLIGLYRHAGARHVGEPA